jgi:hypothetical protein
MRAHTNSYIHRLDSYIHACMHACIYTYTHTYMQALGMGSDAIARRLKAIASMLQVCILVCMCMRVYVCMYVCVCVCVCVCISTSMHVCVRPEACTYNTYIHTFHIGNCLHYFYLHACMHAYNHSCTHAYIQI